MQVWIECSLFHQIGVWTTQASKDSCMNMQASVQKECIEAKKAKQVVQSKHGKQHCTGWRKGMHRANLHHKDASHNW